MLDRADTFSQLGERRGETAGSLLLVGPVVHVGVNSSKVFVRPTDMFGQLGDLASAELGYAPPHMDLLAVAAHQPEQVESIERAGERRIRTDAAAEPDLGGEVGRM